MNKTKASNTSKIYRIAGLLLALVLILSLFECAGSHR